MNTKLFKSKKGVLFTVITILLISTLILFILGFKNRVEFRNEMVLNLLEPTKIKNAQKFIANDFLQIMDLKDLNIKFNQTNQIVKFNLNLTNEKLDYKNLLDNYSNFLNNQFSQISNTNLSVNLNPSFLINPYNTTVSINKTKTKITINQINQINLNITLDTLNNHSTIKNFNLNPGENLLKLTILDKNKEIITKDEYFINFSKSNNFYFEFNNTLPNPKFNINFESSNLTINTTNNLNAKINQKLIYNLDRKIYITTNTDSLFRSEKIKKEGFILLLKG